MHQTIERNRQATQASCLVNLSLLVKVCVKKNPSSRKKSKCSLACCFIPSLYLSSGSSSRQSELCSSCGGCTVQFFRVQIQFFRRKVVLLCSQSPMTKYLPSHPNLSPLRFPSLSHPSSIFVRSCHHMRRFPRRLTIHTFLTACRPSSPPLLLRNPNQRSPRGQFLLPPEMT